MKYLNTLKGLLLTLLLACTSTVFAHDFEENGIYYNILSETDKTVEVTYKGDNAGSFNEYIGVVVIPSTIDVNDITYSVNRIGVFAFKGCKDLKSITIPGSVMEICNSAFDDCTGMQELYLEDCDDPIMCKKEYDSQTVYFFEDSPIESMYIGRDIINYSFSYGVMQWSISLKSVVIGYGMTYINNNIFERCYNLASVAISNNV